MLILTENVSIYIILHNFFYHLCKIKKMITKLFFFFKKISVAFTRSHHISNKSSIVHYEHC